MKKLSFIACALIFMFSGFIFSGCEDRSFKTSKLNISGATTVYNSQNQIFTVSGYKGITVTYSLDGETFGSAEELQLSDAGNYTVYYKVSKKGYKDYTSSVNFKIQQKQINITIPDIIGERKTEEEVKADINARIQANNQIAQGDVLAVNIAIDGYDVITDEYLVVVTDNDANYEVNVSAFFYKIAE